MLSYCRHLGDVSTGVAQLGHWGGSGLLLPQDCSQAAWVQVRAALWPRWLHASIRPRKSWMSSPEAVAEAGCHCTPRANQESLSDSMDSITPSTAPALTRNARATRLTPRRCYLFTS